MVLKEIGGDFSDGDTAIAEFHRRTEDVVKNVPPERLLVFNVAEGWEPLCRFLDASVPDAPFPHFNKEADFWVELAKFEDAARPVDT